MQSVAELMNAGLAELSSVCLAPHDST